MGVVPGVLSAGNGDHHTFIFETVALFELQVRILFGPYAT